MPKSFDIQPKRADQTAIVAPPPKEHMDLSEKNGTFEIIPLLPLAILLTSNQGSSLVFYTAVGSLLYYLLKYRIHYSLPNQLRIPLLFGGFFSSLGITFYFFNQYISDPQVVVFLLITTLLISTIFKKIKSFPPTLFVFLLITLVANWIVSPSAFTSFYLPSLPPLLGIALLLSFIPIIPGPLLSRKASLLFMATLVIISLTSAQSRLLQPLLADVNLIFIALLSAYFTIISSALYGREIARQAKLLLNFRN